MPTLSYTPETRSQRPLSIEVDEGFKFQKLETTSTSLTGSWPPPAGLMFVLRLPGRLDVGRALIAEDVEEFGPIPADLREEIRNSWPA